MKAAKCLEEKGVPERDGGRRQRYNAFFGREKKKKERKNVRRPSSSSSLSRPRLF